MPLKKTSALAEACIHALSKPTASSSLAITDSYHSYHDLLSLICEFSGRPNPLIIDMSDAAFADIMSVSGEMAKLFGFKSGLDIEFVPELLRQELRFDNSEALAQLGYSTGLGLPALQSLVENTEENVFAKTWRQTLNSLKV